MLSAIQCEMGSKATLFIMSEYCIIFLNMDYRKIITIDVGKRGGKPTIRGMRITVDDVLKMMASGMTPENIMHDFPELTADDIRAALAFASRREGETVFATHEIVT